MPIIIARTKVVTFRTIRTERMGLCEQSPTRRTMIGYIWFEKVGQPTRTGLAMG